MIAADPLAGDLMAGTGGARKLRHAGRGKGKSGGFRTVHYFGGNDVPVFLLAIFSKGDKDNLSKAERNALAAILPRIAAPPKDRRGLQNEEEEMSKLGTRLIRSAEEALAIAQGKVEPARVIAAEEIDVAAIRKKMKLSQGKFAKRFRLSTATVRDWEQKRRSPDRIALNLLRVIEEFPDVVARALAPDVEAKTAGRLPERGAIKRAARRAHA